MSKSFSEIEDFLIKNPEEAELIYSLQSTNEVAANLVFTYGMAYERNDDTAATRFIGHWDEWEDVRRVYLENARKDELARAQLPRLERIMGE